MIQAAPRSFGVVVFLVGGLVWFVTSQVYVNQVSGRDTQIGILRDRIGDYEQKLKGKTPDQAAGEIDSLREQLKETKKRLDLVVNPPRDANSI